MGNKKKKEHQLLSKEDSDVMREYLLKRGNIAKLANKVGLSREAVTYQRDNDKFPKYYSCFLEVKKLEKEILTLKEANKSLKRMLQFAFSEFGDLESLKK